MTGDANSAGKKYAEANEQLIVELYVRNLKQSIPFYVELGFTICREELALSSWLGRVAVRFASRHLAQPDPPKTLVANIRIPVPTSIDPGPSAER